MREREKEREIFTHTYFFPKKFHIMKTKSKLWPRTSAVKMNAIDHPFGSGRGKRMKSKIAKRNAPPGKKVGLIRPRRTGRKKR